MPLVTITGANVTKSAFVEKQIHEGYVSQHVALARPVVSTMSRLIHCWLVSQDNGRGQLMKLAYGGGKPGLNLDNVKQVRVALPPKSEQQELLKRLRDGLRRLKKLEDAIESGNQVLAGCDAAILAKAFRGELVPQDPDDEPASVLLERIRVERAASESARQKQKKTRRRKSSKAPAARARPTSAVDAIAAAPAPSPGARSRQAPRSAAPASAPVQASLPFSRPRSTARTTAQTAGAIDSPLLAQLRAERPGARDYQRDHWRAVLIASLQASDPGPIDRDQAMRQAAAWARDHVGLQFKRLPTDGIILTGLRSALNSAIRRKLIARHGPQRIALA